MAALSLQLLGPFTATLNHQPLDNFITNKVQALLIDLAVERDHPHRRESLFTLLWPGMPERSARHNLNQTFYRLRQTFQEIPAKNNEDPVPFFKADRQTIQLNPDAAVYVDIHQVDELLTVTQGHAHPDLAACPNCITALEKALTLYRGDFLSDFYLDDSSEFEAWAEAVRKGYRRKQVDLLATLADISIQNGELDQAIKHIDRQLAIDDLNERAHHQKIQTLALAGHRVEAMRHYRTFKQNLEAQLGAAPSKVITTLYERISKDDLPTAKPWPEPVATKPGIPETDTPRHNLPAQSTPFIGRKTESAEFDKLIPDPETANPPAGTVTFLFTDIQGSTPLWESEPEKMAAALKIHNAALRQAIEAHGGVVFKTVGDSFQAAFSTAPQALDAAIQGQRNLQEAGWNELGELKVRMGLHTGEAQLDPGGDEYAVSHTKNRAARIMSAAYGGQVLLSQETKELVDHQLPDGMTLKDLGEHRLKGMEIPEHLYQVSAPGLQTTFSPLKTGAHPRHNLPTQPTPFIGREDELKELGAMLADPNIRLVTIVGPGGMGKTRLAVAAAERILDSGDGVALRPTDGVFFIDLAPLSEPDQMVSAVADALQFPLQAEVFLGPRQQLLDYLRNQQMLLVFDNFEHVLDGVGLPADILTAAPAVQVLATSRERLHIRSEQVYPIGGMEFPDWETPEDAAQYTAVQLFLQSARRNQPTFEIGKGEDLTYLARTCRLVAGMPLAIELAASWVDMLPLSEIAAGLQEGLDFLETDMRDLPDRHRSIRAAIDYSWAQLDEKERDIFAKLSVFRGGFTRQAAQAVAGANLRQLGRLVNKSFLQYDQAPDRYRVHDLMRQYGAEKLADRGLEAEVRDEHSQFFCTALVAWQKRLESDAFRNAADEVEADYRNVESAWENELELGHLDHLLVAVNGLGEYFDAKGRWYEGIHFFQENTKVLKGNYGEFPTTPEAARLLIWLAAWQVNLDINARSDDIPAQDIFHFTLQPAMELLDLPTLSAVDCRKEEAYLRLQLGRVLKFIEGKLAEGKSQLEISLRIYQELGEPSGISDALYEAHFYALEAENIEEARNFLQKSLTQLPQPEDPRRVNRLLIALGVFARSTQSFEEESSFYKKAYQVAQAAENQLGMFDARHWEVNQGWYLGQFESSLSLSKHARVLANGANSAYREYVSICMMGLSQVYLGKFDTALETFQELSEFRKKHNIPVLLGYFRDFGQPLAHLHTGDYDQVVSLSESKGALESRIWVLFAKSNDEEALTRAEQFLGSINPSDFEWGTRFLSLKALGLFRMGKTVEASQTLWQGVQICVEKHCFVPLMPLITVTAHVLGFADDLKQKERAVELWAMAKALPFIGNSELFSDLFGKPMAALAASLPSEKVAAAQKTGRELDWWETAEALVGELTALGWNEARDVHS